MVGVVRAEKPAVDIDAINKWSTVGYFPLISNDGQYAAYSTLISGSKPLALVIRALAGNWKEEVPGVGAVNFTQDSRKAVFINRQGNLCLLTLGTSALEEIQQVSSFRLFKQGKAEWLLYQSTTPDKHLTLLNLATEKRLAFTSVEEYVLGGDGNTLLLITELKKNGDTVRTVNWITLPDGGKTTIWQGSTAVSTVVMDKRGTQSAFAAKEPGADRAGNTFWYYRAGANQSTVLLNDRSEGIENGLQLGSITKFSRDGSRLFFTLENKEPQDNKFVAAQTDAVKVDVWSYRDVKLQSEQLEELSRSGGYAATVDVRDRHIVRLEGENEYSLLAAYEGKPDDIALLRYNKGNDTERNWNKSAQPVYYILDTRTGARKRLEMGMAGIGTDLSPTGRYLIHLDADRRNFYSYTIATAALKNMTANLPIPLVDEEFDDDPGTKPRNIELLAWLTDESAVLIRDKYDIWQLDISGVKPPLNLTNGYGRRNNIRFNLAESEHGTRTFSGHETLLLTAFNETDENSGFYRAVIGRHQDPELLTMGPYHFSDFAPLKARDAAVWIVRRERASESGNFFWTRDFKTYQPLSDDYPERAYNWLTSELINFKTLDNRSTQGALYKPESFDPKKKYPIIIEYYEKRSHELNAYNAPQAMGEGINTPWFVSRGYLVFTPDIRYTIGEPGQSAYSTIVAAAEYLKTFPWVDGARMGIQGHSFGGYETLYVVTHTPLFAAAMSASGFGDLISLYGAITGSGDPGQRQWAENGQGRIGATLWERPDLYIKNSPIFLADKVTTPLLMMNNKKDGIVDFSQGVEFFTALRRLGKKAWMLQYDGEDHRLGDDKAKAQHTIRVTQFFDHYLKDAPPPKWMTEGIPARLKGIETGLELDTSGKEPGPGLNTNP
jgi:dipeptidyl aminopeptidase/acylaminoacyl peptidase